MRITEIGSTDGTVVAVKVRMCLVGVTKALTKLSDECESLERESRLVREV